MNLIETLILIFLFIVIVLNFISEPKLSFEYYKSYLKTGKNAVVWCVNFVKNIVNGAKHESVPVQSSGNG